MRRSLFVILRLKGRISSDFAMFSDIAIPEKVALGKYAIKATTKQ